MLFVMNSTRHSKSDDNRTLPSDTQKCVRQIPCERLLWYLKFRPRRVFPRNVELSFFHVASLSLDVYWSCATATLYTGHILRYVNNPFSFQITSTTTRKQPNFTFSITKTHKTQNHSVENKMLWVIVLPFNYYKSLLW